LNVCNEYFYNKELFAIVPMGFCYHGKGTNESFLSISFDLKEQSLSKDIIALK